MRTKYWVMLAGMALVLAQSTAAFAQLNANGGAPAVVSLNAVMSETLSVSAAPGTLNFTPLNPNGTTHGDAAISINTAWVLQPSRGSLNVWAYFAGATALTNTSDATAIIPVTSVTGKVNAGSFQGFNDPLGAFAPGTSLSIFSVGVLGKNKNNSQTDTLALKVDTTGAGMPAGTYTGTLFIQAVAN